MSALPHSKEVPHDYEYEETVLGYLMTPASPPMYERFAGITKAEHFWNEAHREVFAAIQEIAQGGGLISVRSVFNILKSKNKLSTIGGYSFLEQCVSRVTVTHGDVEWYGRELRRLGLQRRVLEAASQMIQLASTDKSEGDLIGSALEIAMEIGSASEEGKGVRSIAEVIDGGLRKQVGAITGLESSDVRYIPTGLRELDFLIRGFRKSGLYLLSTITSGGKSLFVQDRSIFLGENGHGVLTFTTEMSDEDVAARQVFMMAGMDEVLVRARRDMTDGISLDEAMNHAQSLPLYYKDTAGLTIEQLEVTVHRELRKRVIDLVIVDHFHELRTEKKFNRDDLALEYIAQRLKDIARIYDIPVLAVAQQNRGDHGGNLNASLKGTSALEQKADTIVFLQPVSDDGTAYLEPDEARERASDPGWMRVKAKASKVRTGGRTGSADLVLDWSVGGRFFDWDEWEIENQDRIKHSKFSALKKMVTG